MKKFLKDNGLSLAFIALFLITLLLQIHTGFIQHNQDLEELGASQVGLGEYLGSGHFIEAVMENFESEFLQMGLFVWFTTFLYQKGSSESKDPDKKEEVDREPSARRKNVPWAVRKGGLALTLYKYSLSIVLFLIFVICFIGHWYGSLKDYNEEQLLKHERLETAMSYLGNSRLWFESFQNWQSEFLSIFAIVLLSVFFRHKGSSQSKPVDAPHSETGG